MQMMNNAYFNDKKILVIDKSPKNKNDHTWCFWEKQTGLFESVVHHRWNKFNFYSDFFSSQFKINPYEYKMIRAIDFYNYVLNKAKQFTNISFVYGNVQSIGSENKKAIINLDNEMYLAEYIFNSIPFKPQELYLNKYYFLKQHFKGWLIEAEENVFDEQVATFMDFRISQQQGTAFVYVLPISEKRALIEYTLFSHQLLQKNEYDFVLKDYIYKHLKIEDYKIIEEEFGVIPMTDFPFSSGKNNIVNIGTAGGQTKASSGFTFQSIQKNSIAIVNALIKKKNPHLLKSFLKKRFDLYDRVLLNILHYKKLGGDVIFASMFKNNPPQKVLKFLDNETDFYEELKIMQTVPTNIFLPAALKELIHF